MTGRIRNPRGQGDRLRTELIAAARRIAERENSTEALSIRSVAKEAGVAATSVYLHFRDREEIFRAAVADDYRALAEAMQAARSAGGGDPVARLRALGRAYCRFAVEQPGSYRLITEVSQPIPDNGPRPEGHPAKAAQAALEGAVADCQAAGFANGMDRDLLVACLWSGWHGFIELRRSKPQREWPDVDAVVDLFVASLIGALAASAPTGKEVTPANPSGLRLSNPSGPRAIMAPRAGPSQP